MPVFAALGIYYTAGFSSPKRGPISMAEARAILVFDGNCAICRTWVNYWQRLTNGRIVYCPYQTAAADFPAIAREDFERAIWLIEPNGQVYSGAAAAYRLLSYAPCRGGGWWMYRRVTGFSAASEWAYSFFAGRRDLLSRATRLLWGSALEPERNALVSFVFLRLFGAVYATAFASLGVQILGLVGHAGILPVGSYLSAARQGWGTDAYWQLPTLCWLDSSDTVLLAATMIGVLPNSERRRNDRLQLGQRVRRSFSADRRQRASRMPRRV
jgi:predicted DCC family thiol-disulfide oxidoreductase YuxK